MFPWDAIEEMRKLDRQCPELVTEWIKYYFPDFDRARLRDDEYIRQYNEGVSFVYLFKASNGFIKIGRSDNPDKRLRTLQQQGGDPGMQLLLYAATMNAKELEARFHKEYTSQRRVGEWFELSHAEIGSIGREMMRIHRDTVLTHFPEYANTVKDYPNG